MNYLPDSSLNILKSIRYSALKTNQEKAYYALLYTQCLHKNYLPIVNDSLISLAVDYYLHEKEWDKYAKSLIYKGISLEEMYMNTMAMEMYKKAEEISAESSDFLLKGLINSRIGMLYSKKLIENNEDIKYYKNAKDYFNKARHYANLNSILSLIGQHYRVGQTNRDSAYYYINQAIELAQQREDSVSLLYNKALLANTYYLDGNYKTAKEICLFIIRNKNNSTLSDEVYNCLSRSYAALYMIDSAYHYSGLINIRKNDSLSYYLTNKIIAEKSGDFKKAFDFFTLSQRISDSIINSARKMDIYDVEKRYDYQKLVIKNQDLQIKNQSRLLVIILVSIFFAGLLFVELLIIKRKQKELEEIRFFLEQLKSSSLMRANTLNCEISTTISNEEKLKKFLDRKLHTIRQLIDLSYRYESTPKAFIKHFKSIIRTDNLDEGVLNDLVDIVNVQHNRIIDHLAKKHPELNSDDLKLIALICCNFSAIEMTVFFNYTNEKSIYGRKKRLTQKMKIESNIDDYISGEIRIISS